MANENATGRVCYLGTCYHLLANSFMEHSFDEVKEACGDNHVALPRSPLELTFLKNRLSFASKASRAWIGLEVKKTEVRRFDLRTEKNNLVE